MSVTRWGQCRAEKAPALAAGEPVTFTVVLTTGAPPIAFTWHWGDVPTPTVTTVTYAVHTFATAGAVPVMLTAYNNCVLAARDVLIEEAVAGLAAADDSPTALGTPTALTATVTAGTGVSYTWTLGDGAFVFGPCDLDLHPPGGGGLYRRGHGAQQCKPAHSASPVIHYPVSCLFPRTCVSASTESRNSAP